MVFRLRAKRFDNYSVLCSAILNSAGGMGDGGLSPPEEGVAGQDTEGGNGLKAQVRTPAKTHELLCC